MIKLYSFENCNKVIDEISSGRVKSLKVCKSKIESNSNPPLYFDYELYTEDEQPSNIKHNNIVKACMLLKELATNMLLDNVVSFEMFYSVPEDVCLANTAYINPKQQEIDKAVFAKTLEKLIQMGAIRKVLDTKLDGYYYKVPGTKKGKYKTLTMLDILEALRDI